MPTFISGKDVQTLPFRGRRSRNKVSVGEPAEGSLACFWRCFLDVFIGRIKSPSSSKQPDWPEQPKLFIRSLSKKSDSALFILKI